MTSPTNTAIIGGAVAGGVVLIVVLGVVVLVWCGVVCYRRNTKDEGHVEASFVPQGTGTFSYTKADNDSTVCAASPPLYNTLPPQSSRPTPLTLTPEPSRPIPVNHRDKEREMEKELLSDNIPDGPLPFPPPPTYRNLLEAEQMSPANMKTSEPVSALQFEQYVAKRDEKKGLLFEKEFKVR